MREYLKAFFDEFEYSKRERLTLSLAYEKIAESGEGCDLFVSVIAGYDRDPKSLTDACYESIKKIAELSGVHLYTVLLLALICMTRKLRERLLKLELTKKNVFLTLSDLKYKMWECERVYGTVGTDKWQWYAKLFMPNVFAMGRLQFEIALYQGKKYEIDGKRLDTGSPVIKVHIPASGEPLLDRLASSSYREAKKFFGKLFPTSAVPFMCSSWLLSPINREILDEKSNIVKFSSRYGITEVVESKSDGSLYPWIFGMPEDTPIERLPRDTKLRAGYAALLERGERTSIGTGIFFLDDPKPKE